MSIETYQFNLPITPGAIPPVLHLSQYDSGRTFTAVLRDDANVPFELDASATAVIKGRNAAGIAWQQNCTVSGANVTFAPSGAATDQFGVMPVTIEITESEEIISPLLMIFDIQKAGYTNEEAVLSPDFETAIQAAVAQAISEGGLGFSDEFKQALLDWCAHTSWDDTDGQDRYDALEAALYPDVHLVSITAAYDQDRPIYPDSSLDDVKLDLTVTANYSDGTSEAVTTYALTGTLTVGTSTLTVSYGGKSTTIDVVVTQGIDVTPSLATAYAGNAQRTNVVYDSSTNSLRVSTKTNWQYVSAVIDFETDPDYEYYTVFDVNLVTGNFRCRYQSGTNALNPAFDPINTAGQHHCEYVFTNESVADNIRFYITWAESPAIAGDATISNFKVYKRPKST